MDFFLSSGFSIACWTFTTVVMSYNIRNMRPRSLRWGETERLREQALALLAKSDKEYFDKHRDQDSIESEKNFEYLRLYARLVDKHTTSTLSSLVESLRMQRMRLRTSLRSKNVTDEGIIIYEKIMEFATPFTQVSNLGRNAYRKRRYSVAHCAFYAMKHPDEAERIISIMEDRGFTKIRDIRKLARDMDELPASALSEGML